jgi:hypothetical protein
VYSLVTIDDILNDLYMRLPANARILGSSVLGEKKTTPITEKDFREDELAALRRIVQETKLKNQRNQENYRNEQYTTPSEYRRTPQERLVWNEEGTRAVSGARPYSEYINELKMKEESYNKNPSKTSVGYSDYNNKEGSHVPVLDGWIDSLRWSMKDPRFALKGALGSFNAYDQPDGGLKIEDSYGFKDGQQWFYRDASQRSLPEILKQYWDSPGSLGEVLMNKYQKDVARPVNIKLK